MQTKNCEYCWKEFNPGYHKFQRFCCYECSNKARITHKDIECLQCWIKFHPKDKTNKFCSRECWYKYNRLPNKRCKTCWKEFHPNVATQIFCSVECRWKAARLDNIICPVCNKEFKPKTRDIKYCSGKCKSIWDKKQKDIKNTTLCPGCNKQFIKKRKHQKYCSTKCWLKSRGMISKENERFWKLLTQLKFEWSYEFFLWWYYYDFKIWDILIENNPYPFHNSTYAPPRPGVKPKERTYHYNKYKCAIDNWYKCIMVWDWTSNLIDMITNEQFHYEWPPQLHYYNPKTKEHLVDINEDKSLIDKWFVEIRDCGKETF